MSSTEPPAEALERLFLAPDAPLGATWLQNASIPLSDDALHHLVLKSKIPSLIQARSSYGHFRTASQMHKVPGSYWPSAPDLSAALEQAPLRLNPTPAAPLLTRLHSLYSDPIGGVLLVTMRHHEDGPISEPYITIVAAPSLMTLGHFSAADPPGIDYDDFWDDSVFKPFNLSVGEGLHCPLLAAAEGFSRSVKLPGVVDFIETSQPALFPSGEQLADCIQTTAGSIYRAFFLPEVCDMPIGMAWPTTTSLEDFYSSIRALKGGYSNFLLVLTALQPQLKDWFEAVHQTPASFSSSSLPFVNVHSIGYPPLGSGDIPEAILDERAFSPLLEMLQGFLWRLTSDAALTTGSIEAQQVFALYLARGEQAITADCYLGAALHGRLCPNFAYHFRAGARWPTRVNPLKEVILSQLISERARDYEPITINLYETLQSPLRLVTKDAQSTAEHRRQTPTSAASIAPAATPVPSGAPALLPVTDHTTRQYSPAFPSPFTIRTPAAPPTPFLYPPPGQPANLGPPAQTVLYSPPAPMPPGHPPPSGNPQRTLGPAFTQSMGLAAPPIRRSDPVTATILTAQGRQEASPEFLNCCRLLTHHDPHLALTNNQLGVTLPASANLFPRQPTEHFRRDVLGPIHSSSGIGGYQPVFYNYVEALLSRKGVLVESAYSKTFFTVERAKTLFSVESWAMSSQTRDLLHLPSQTLHVYSFLQCLSEYSTHPTVLPAAGITLLQAKNLGTMVQLLFQMMDMKPDFLTSTFDSSLLGQRLLQWSNLTDSAAIHHIWKENPRLLTFLWFGTLRDVLAIMHSWVKAQRFHGSLGFYSASNVIQGGQCLLLTDSFPSHIPGQTTSLVEAFARYDMQFAARWYDAALSPYDPTWKSNPPSDQFVPTPLPSSEVRTDHQLTRRERDTAAKRLKTANGRAARPPADFICGAHLFEPLVPLPQGKPAITTIMARLKRSVRFPQIPNANGTLDYMCFHSSFPAPHNRCTTAKCKNNFVSPPTIRLHVDPSVEPFKSKPESFWQPIVTFLLQPEVAEHFKPSAVLISLTPSTTWT